MATEPDAEYKAEITVRHFKAGNDWLSASELDKLANESRKLWGDLGEQQLGLRIIIRDCLVELLRDPDKWLPASLAPAADNKIELQIAFAMERIQEEIVATRAREERNLVTAQDDLRKLADQEDDN